MRESYSMILVGGLLVILRLITGDWSSVGPLVSPRD